jgi:hypothetical protein
MIFAQTPLAFVARENRNTLCATAALRVRIMLQVPRLQPSYGDIIDQPRRSDFGGDQDA